jgi:hypothetical protein
VAVFEGEADAWRRLIKELKAFVGQLETTRRAPDRWECSNVARALDFLEQGDLLMASQHVAKATVPAEQRSPAEVDLVPAAQEIFTAEALRDSIDEVESLRRSRAKSHH